MVSKCRHGVLLTLDESSYLPLHFAFGENATCNNSKLCILGLSECSANKVEDLTGARSGPERPFFGHTRPYPLAARWQWRMQQWFDLSVLGPSLSYSNGRERCNQIPESLLIARRSTFY